MIPRLQGQIGARVDSKCMIHGSSLRRGAGHRGGTPTVTIRRDPLCVNRVGCGSVSIPRDDPGQLLPWGRTLRRAGWFVNHQGWPYATTPASSWTIRNGSVRPEAAVLVGGEKGDTARLVSRCHVRAVSGTSMASPVKR